LFDPRSFAGRQIVNDDDIALREGGNQAFFRPFLEQGGFIGWSLALCQDHGDGGPGERGSSGAGLSEK
jgi:hypothetical protein